MFSKKAFTLIELLIVIAIIALLTAVVLPYVQNYILETRLSKAKSDLSEISKALTAYETCEGVYEHSSTGPLEGRYLQDSHADPWGSEYVVATAAGYVFTPGPDRIPGNFDDIFENYQPPLAIVNIKWVDANNTGFVDTQNTPDYLMFQFSRRIASESPALRNPATAYQYFEWNRPNGLELENAFNWNKFVLDNSGALITLPLADGLSGIFGPGSDSIWIKDGDGLRDMASNTYVIGGNRCIASQVVIITSLKQ